MLLVRILPVVAFESENTNEWTGYAAIGWYEEDRYATTFTIDTTEELAGLAALVNDGLETFEGKSIVLESSLDLAGFKWAPIGTEVLPFLGNFYGNNHTISNLNVGDDVGGLVGVMGNSSLTISNQIINCCAVGNAKGGQNVGGLIGRISGNNVAPPEVLNSYARGIASVDTLGVGGLFGAYNFIIYLDNCFVNSANPTSRSIFYRNIKCGLWNS